MKKVLTILMVTLLSIMVVSCKKNNESESSKITPNTAPQDYTGVIGISKIIAHPALDSIEKGIIDELQAQGYTKLTLDMQNANGEISTAASIANRFKSENAIVVVGIATPMALSLANAIKDTPIVFTAVTDPIDAGLRKSNDTEKTNITGLSDMTPVKEQIQLITKLKDAKKIGYIYNAGESNSIVLLNIAKQVCDELGIELVTSTVTNTSEVKQAAEILAPKVDAFYVGTDNVVYAALPSLVPTAAKYKVPVIASVPEDNEGTGILAAYGVDYYNAGRQTGKIIIRILQGENPGDIPVKYMTQPDELGFYLDENVAKDMGITINQEVLNMK